MSQMSPPPGGSDPSSDPTLSPLPGEDLPTLVGSRSEASLTIGPYHLLQKIGEGGMGEVWLAEQKQPVRRRVALKLIRAGLNTREIVARFESERQALALFDHPAIAKIFDAGSTAEGLPYFVMEYVAGLPITEYCDRHKLGVEARLKLFMAVCEGVQHAHQKAVIHRDLKPSNVLVSELDGKPMPKIIDFGVAKAVSQQLTPETLFTRIGSIIGTPEYMSPEQADSSGEDIDTRSDVYSLGVIFYELLVGALPLDFKAIRNFAFQELLRRLREEQAPRPSTKVRTSGEHSSLAARNRQTDPAALGKQLRGDLDSIALKALEKDRSRRYGSPSDFAADLGRYLHHEPVLAAPPSLSYRAGKFVRRHWLAVAAAGAVALALLAIAIIMTVQSARIARERDRANTEAEAARRVADFLVGIFEVSDPEQSRGNTITAREILEKGARRIDRDLAAQPKLKARMMATIGRVYEGIGLFPAAAGILRKAIHTQERTLGPDHRDTLESQRLLSRVLQYQGQYPEAETLLHRTYERQKRVLGPEDPDTLRSASNLGGLYYQQGRYAEAEKLLSSTLAVSRRLLGPEDPQTLAVLHNLAMAYDGLHLASKEEAAWRDLVAARRRVLGPDHPGTLAAIQNLAYFEYRAGRYAEAEKLQREALETGLRVEGKDHPDIASSLGNLANTLLKENRLAEAEKLQRQALETRRRVLGENSPETFYAMNNLASTLVAQERYKEAESLYVQALEGEKRVLGENHPELITLWYDLGSLKAVEGDLPQALAYLRTSVEHGYDDPEELSADASFKRLRASPEYQSLLSRVRQNAAARRK